MDNELAQKISAIRKMGVSYVEIAAFVGCTEATVYRWSKGKKALNVYKKRIDLLFNQEVKKNENKDNG